MLRKRIFFTNCLHLYAFPLSEHIPQIKPKLEVQIYQLRNIPESSRFNLLEIVNEQICQTRFRQGEMVWVAVYRSQIAAYCWVAFYETEIGEIKKIIKIRKDEIYLYDAFTLPDYRGNNLYPFLLTNICYYGKENGYTRALIFALSNNIPSQLGIQKAGFKQFQVIKYRKILGIPWYRYSSLATGQRGVILLPQ
jgi:GNAT superfamily N-acetyltransferase